MEGKASKINASLTAKQFEAIEYLLDNKTKQIGFGG